ncbi:hypothetical protein [Paracoccus sp. SM22M-07]|uniref:hypothetical protein n=1 Tax=Paracoccus sp. SM22M-07 TaxID=1520813 RepID=UPI000B233ABA|nr:hypothetical protein [Paracoccus sp. SM22M-07]
MEKNNEIYFPVQPRTILIYLTFFNIILSFMFPISIALDFWTIKQWFDLDGEVSIPTWYSSSQLLVSGLFILAALRFRRPGSPRLGFYLLVGLGLIFLSADEASSIHEKLTPLSAKYAQFVPLIRGNQGAWITIYGVIFSLILTINYNNILQMWLNYKESLQIFVFGLCVLVSGAVLMEITMYYSLLPSKVMQLILEEFMEMMGGSIILISSFVFFNNHVEVRAAQR